MAGIDWTDLSAKLKAPFSPDAVSWRVQGKAGANGKAQACAYLSSRDVMDRLDEVCGPENWSFDWTPVVSDTAKGLLVAKGTLTIYGVSKSDVGDASTFEGTKGTVSDALKRAAVHWGIGRYLYELPAVWVTMDGNRIADSEKPRLRTILTGEKPQAQRPAAPAKPAQPTPIKPAQPATPQTPREKMIARIHELCAQLGEEAPNDLKQWSDAKLKEYGISLKRTLELKAQEPEQEPAA